jgi:glycerate kinase
VNPHNVLLGAQGVTRVYGPQKGATLQQIVRLEAGLETYAQRIREATGHSVGLEPGSGASGGIGTGLMALLGARLHARFDIVMRHLNLDSLLAEADLVITAEGRLDGQGAAGKVPCEVARRARRHSVPVIALAGGIGHDARATLAHGIGAFASIVRNPCTLDEAIADAATLLTLGAEDALRMVGVGIALAGRRRSALRQRTPPRAESQ